MKIAKHQVYELKLDSKNNLIVERKKDKKITKRKYNRVMEWITTLKKGKYTIRQLKEISGSSNGSSIIQQLTKYGAVVENHFDKSRNLIKNIIIWNGYKKEKGAQ